MAKIFLLLLLFVVLGSCFLILYFSGFFKKSLDNKFSTPVSALVSSTPVTSSPVSAPATSSSISSIEDSKNDLNKLHSIVVNLTEEFSNTKIEGDIIILGSDTSGKKVDKPKKKEENKEELTKKRAAEEAENERLKQKKIEKCKQNKYNIWFESLPRDFKGDLLVSIGEAEQARNAKTSNACTQSELQVYTRKFNNEEKDLKDCINYFKNIKYPSETKTTCGSSDFKKFWKYKELLDKCNKISDAIEKQNCKVKKDKEYDDYWKSCKGEYKSCSKKGDCCKNRISGVLVQKFQCDPIGKICGKPHPRGTSHLLLKALTEKKLSELYYKFGNDDDIINVTKKVKTLLNKSDFDKNILEKDFLYIDRLRKFGKGMGLPYLDELRESHFKKYNINIFTKYLSNLKEKSINYNFITNTNKKDYVDCSDCSSMSSQQCCNNHKTIIRSLITHLNFNFTYNDSLKTKYKNGEKLDTVSSKIILEYLLLNDNLENVFVVISDIILLFWVSIYTQMGFLMKLDVKNDPIFKKLKTEIPKRFSFHDMSIIGTILGKCVFTLGFLKYEIISPNDIRELNKFITFISSDKIPNLFTIKKEVVVKEIVLKISKLILTSGLYFNLNSDSQESLKKILEKESNTYQTLFDKIDYYNLLKALLETNLLDEFIKFIKKLKLSEKIDGLAGKLDKIKQQFDKNVTEFKK